MDSQDPNIEEKLVPFVEGALAEADRREVLQALPNQPGLNAEVRQLRDVILALRSHSAAGLTYRHPVELPANQVVDQVMQGERASRPVQRAFQLAALESPSLAEEIAILQELEQELQQRVEASRPVPEMPAALRAAIQETYGKAASEPEWKRSFAAAAAWFGAFNLRTAAAALAGVAVIVGGVSVGRMTYTKMQGQSAATTTTVTTTPSAVPSAVATAATPSDSAPAGQVAVLDRKVHPEDLPRLSRILWQKQVSHSYRDGQIFVAKGDLDRAWEALALNEQVATTKLKTGEVPKPADKGGLIDGIIGVLPDVQAARKNKEMAAAKPAPVAAKAASEPGPATGVAIHLPAAPEASRGGDDANYNVLENKNDVPAYRSEGPAAAAPNASPANDPAPTEPSAPAPASQPQRQSAPVAEPRSAPPAVHQRAIPSQVARAPQQQAPERQHISRTQPRRQQAARPSEPAAAPTPVRSRVAQEEGRTVGNAVAVAPRVQAIRPAPPAPAPEPRPSSEPRPARAVTAVRPQPAPVSPAPRSAEPRLARAAKPASPQPIAAVPARPAITSSKSTVAAAEVPDRNVQAESPSPRPINPVAAAPVTDVADRERDSERLRAARSAMREESPESPVPAGMKPVPKLSEARKEVDRRDSMAPKTTGGMAARATNSSDSFVVPAGAPFEVAMLPVAKKLIEELVGPSKVQMERKDDGHLLVTIRPERSLTPSEVEKLRKTVREKLELKDEDTVVIRQP